MRVGLPSRLATGPRVIKRIRGNCGEGVWKVEPLASLKRTANALRSTTHA
jgi:glutathione synthase/RimK-type ligase-like ATP-grasp enzyme